MKAVTAQKVLWSVLIVLAGARRMAYADEIERAPDSDTQRVAIEESRRNQSQRLDARTTDCAQKFAVTRCLEQVHQERLQAEGNLNRQEAVLNDAQRLERGRERMERNREKAVAHAEKMVNLARQTATSPKQPKPLAEPTAPARQGFTDASKASVPSTQERSANTKNYARKQEDATAKRAEVAKRLREAGTTKPSLPQPD